MQTTNQLIESRSRSNSVRSNISGSESKKTGGGGGLISGQRLQEKHFNNKNRNGELNDQVSGSRSPKRDTNTQR